VSFYANFYNERPLRERLLLALCCISGIYGGWETFLHQPALGEQKLRQGQIRAEIDKIKQLAKEQTALASVVVAGPVLARKRELTALEIKAKAGRERLEALSKSVVPPIKLPEALREAMAAYEGLELIGVETLEPRPIELGAKAVESHPTASIEGQPDVASGIYKHEVIVTLQGRFFDILSYLRRLTALPWRFYWTTLDYAVENYPIAVVTLRVHTLSTGKGVFRD
jgi:MSHA biogenesis protein MshJ